jgi:penicillin amidase
MKEFESALKEPTAPGINVMYADPQNIAWWMLGDIAVKKNPNSDLILNGASGADEYERMLTWEEKPHEVNPTSGIIVSANSRPYTISDRIRGDWQSTDRYNTLKTLLNEKDLWNAAETKELQTSNFSSMTKVLLDIMLDKLQLSPEELNKYGKTVESLKVWNHHSEINSQEASVYYQWINECVLLMLESLGEDRAAYLNTPYAWIFFERTMQDPESPWWRTKGQSEVLSEAFRRTMSKSPEIPAWGDIHTIEYIHPLGREFPLSLFFNVGPFPMPGAYNEITNNKQRGLGGDFKVIAGASTRRVIDFAEPQRSWGINPIGISGHKLSPYYGLEAAMFLNGEYRPQLMDTPEIDKAKTHEMILSNQ